MLHYHHIITLRTSMVAKCEIFMNCSKTEFAKTKYDWQEWKTKGSIHVVM